LLQRFDRIGLDVVNKFVEEYLEDEVVPDILANVLHESAGFTDNYTDDTPEGMVCYATYDEICTTVIKSELKDILLKEIRSMVDDVIARAKASRGPSGALVKVRDQLIMDVIEPMCKDLVIESVKELVKDFKFLNSFEKVMKTLLTPLVFELVNEVLDEVAVENQASSLIEELVKSTAKSVAHESVDEFNTERESQERELEIQQINKVSKILIDGTMYHHLLGIIGRQAEAISVRDELRNLYQMHMSRAALSNLTVIDSLCQDLEENAPLNAAYQYITAKSGLQILLSKLDHVLDETEASIDREERMLSVIQNRYQKMNL